MGSGYKSLVIFRLCAFRSTSVCQYTPLRRQLMVIDEWYLNNCPQSNFLVWSLVCHTATVALASLMRGREGGRRSVPSILLSFFVTFPLYKSLYKYDLIEFQLHWFEKYSPMIINAF